MEYTNTNKEAWEEAFEDRNSSFFTPKYNKRS